MACLDPTCFELTTTDLGEPRYGVFTIWGRNGFIHVLRVM